MKTIIEFDYSIGEKVKVKDIDRTGTVTSLTKDMDGTMYRVAYWVNGQRYCEWMYHFELQSA